MPIEQVPDGIHRPLWSVMIPTFNCAKYLRETLQSVLAQNFGPEQMQIEVIDDCSTKDDPETVIRELGQGRVSFYRRPKNGGVTANFNTCLQRSRGLLVHILHGDDYVLPGFYQRSGKAAQLHPDAALFATRCFFVDEEGVIISVTARLPELETVSRATNSFLYGTPIQCAGVVVRRSFYETHGGFVPGLVHAADSEMWTRATAFAGSLITPDVIACYRVFASNDSGRLARTGENLKDIERLGQIFEKRYPEFDHDKARRRLCDLALQQAIRFFESGDVQAAKINLNYWRKNAKLSWRLRHFAAKTFLRLLDKNCYQASG